jgi:hypothetical protein
VFCFGDDFSWLREGRVVEAVKRKLRTRRKRRGCVGGLEAKELRMMEDD